MQPFNDMETTLALLLIAGVAAISDIRSHKIPNQLILIGLITGLGLSALINGIDGLLASTAGFFLGFSLLLPGYLLRFTGAGDLKLLATLGVFSGPIMLLKIFAASVLTGALFVLLLVLWGLVKKTNSTSFRRYKEMLKILLATGQLVYLHPETDAAVIKPVLSRRIPMAPMFAAGSLIAIVFPLIKP